MHHAITGRATPSPKTRMPLDAAPHSGGSVPLEDELIMTRVRLAAPRWLSGDRAIAYAEQAGDVSLQDRARSLSREPESTEHGHVRVDRAAYRRGLGPRVRELDDLTGEGVRSGALVAGGGELERHDRRLARG